MCFDSSEIKYLFLVHSGRNFGGCLIVFLRGFVLLLVAGLFGIGLFRERLPDRGAHRSSSEELGVLLLLVPVDILLVVLRLHVAIFLLRIFVGIVHSHISISVAEVVDALAIILILLLLVSGTGSTRTSSMGKMRRE